MTNLLSSIANETTTSEDTSLNLAKNENNGVSEEVVAENAETNSAGLQTVTDGVEDDLEPTQADRQLLAADENDIINIDIAPIKKKRFCINGNLDNMLELNVSDVNVVQRLTQALKKLNALQQKAAKVSASMSGIDDDELALQNLADALKAIDDEMRELVDFIFNAPVSQACANDGSMYDMFKGAFRYEHIIESLMKMYQANIKVEYSEMRSKLSKHTSKYTKKRR